MGQSSEKTNSYIWNPKAETMPRTELTVLQTHRLQQQVARVYERVPSIEAHSRGVEYILLTFGPLRISNVFLLQSKTISERLILTGSLQCR